MVSVVPWGEACNHCLSDFTKLRMLPMEWAKATVLSLSWLWFLKHWHFHSWLPPNLQGMWHVLANLYFRAITIPWLRSHNFTWQDVVNAINESTCRRCHAASPNTSDSHRNALWINLNFCGYERPHHFLKAQPGNLSTWELHGAKHKLHLVR